MTSGIQYSFENQSTSLVDALTQKSTEIIWAEDVTYIFKRINEIYHIYGRIIRVKQSAAFLALKVKELEKYLSLNIQRHIALKNANTPYYVARIAQQLDSIMTHLNANQDGDNFVESTEVDRAFDHLAAALQATFAEYGFCSSIDAIFEVQEASKKLDALSQKLSALDKSPNGVDHSVVIATINDVMASQNGIQQALTDTNFLKLKSRFDELSLKIIDLENNYCLPNIGPESALFMEYLAHQHLLRTPFVDSVIQTDTFDVINSHMIHSGTRGWVLDIFERWLSSEGKRVFYLSGKQGAGKTAIAATICKLYNYDVVANHFCAGAEGDVFKNKMNGIVQSIVAGLCRTIPEYLNWLDDKYGNGNDVTKVTSTWREAYDSLIKEPIQSLYGVGKNVNLSLKSRVIVIDGLDEMDESEWPEFKLFQKQFCDDLAPAFRLFITMRLKFFSNLVVLQEDIVQGIRLEDRSTANRHIKDIEIYLSSSLGAILSGEDEVDVPMHAKSDEMTLQNTVDELLKCTAGRFDYAIQLMESFASAFSSSGQFLSSVKRATQPVRQSIGNEYDQKISDFASPYRAYRDKEGRSVTVRVMRQSQYLMDKTRVALIRGRHQHQDA